MKSPKRDHIDFQIILDKIQSSTNEIRHCISIVDEKIDNAMTMIRRLENTCQKLDDRMTIIEENNLGTKTRLAAVESTQEDVQAELTEVKNTIINLNDQVTTNISEQLNRYQRRLNLIIKGVPENENSDDLLAELFQIIWPGNPVPCWTRIGELKPNAVTTRPIRIPMLTANDKRTILSNCKKLKGVESLKGISVSKDLTKTQQEESKKQYILRSTAKKLDEARTKSANKKRKLTDEKEVSEVGSQSCDEME